MAKAVEKVLEIRAWVLAREERAGPSSRTQLLRQRENEERCLQIQGEREPLWEEEGCEVGGESRLRSRKIRG